MLIFKDKRKEKSAKIFGFLHIRGGWYLDIDIIGRLADLIATTITKLHVKLCKGHQSYRGIRYCEAYYLNYKQNMNRWWDKIWMGKLKIPYVIDYFQNPGKNYSFWQIWKR